MLQHHDSSQGNNSQERQQRSCTCFRERQQEGAPMKTLTKSMMAHKLSDVNDGIIDGSNNSLAKAVMTSLSGPPASSSLPIALAQPPFVTF